MDRGAWQATVHGVTRVSHDLATKQPPTTVNLHCKNTLNLFWQATDHTIDLEDQKDGEFSFHICH